MRKRLFGEGRPALFWESAARPRGWKAFPRPTLRAHVSLSAAVKTTLWSQEVHRSKPWYLLAAAQDMPTHLQSRPGAEALLRKAAGRFPRVLTCSRTAEERDCAWLNTGFYEGVTHVRVL